MNNAGNDKTKTQSLWRRWISWIAALEDAMDVTHAEIQERRIALIEADLLKLRLQMLDRPANGAETRSASRS